MNTIWSRHEETRIASMLHELTSDLATMVESGDLSDVEANEWLDRKAEQWARGLS